MYRRKAKQDWSVGAVVNVGFTTGLTVIEKIPTPGDGLPDKYILRKGDQFYEFTPHNGMVKIDAPATCAA